VRPIASLVGVAALTLAGRASAQIPELARGKTVDVINDASDTRHFDEAWVGRMFVPREALGGQGSPKPLVVFLHGVNTDHTRFRFVGGKPEEPDLRIIVARLVERGAIPPLVLGAPTTTVACDLPITLWPSFDLDRFVERAVRALRPHAAIDLERVVVVGHSGAGCNATGGLMSAVAGTSLHLRGVLSVDTCMAESDAQLAAITPPGTDLIVTWQPLTWPRPFDLYASIFRAASGAATGRRLLEEFRPPVHAHAHNAMVELTLEKHLTAILAGPPG
jgi:pimeloyl-ACP methyl ester carboxylesterase